MLETSSIMQITDLLEKLNLDNEKATDKDGNTALHLAIKSKGMTEIEIIEALKILLDKNLDVNVENKNKETALHVAVIRRMKDVIDFLIKRKANIDKIAHYVIQSEYETFCEYIRKNCLEDIEIKNIETARAIFLEWLMSRFDFDYKNKDNKSALNMAIEYDLQHLLPVLFKNTKNINDIDKQNKTLLHLFLEKNAEYRGGSRNEFRKWYSERYAVDIVKTLIKRDPSQINMKDKTGSSPLHVTAGNSSSPIVQILIELGAKVNCRNKDKKTPLHCATSCSENSCIVEVVKLLLEKGANENAQDSKGLTALHQIAMERRTEYSLSTVKLLLEYGANILVKTQKGLAVLSYARYGDHCEYKRARQECIRKHNLNQSYYYDDDDHVVMETAMGYEDCPIEPWTSEVLDLLSNHSIALKAADFPWGEEHENWVYYCNTATIEPDDYEQSYKYCFKEVGKLKNTFIDLRVSLYTFIHMNPSRRCAYINNEKLQELVQSTKLEDEFPEYSILILGKYHEALTRKSLLVPAKETWLELTNIDLPDICIECILSLLSNSDLFDII